MSSDDPEVQNRLNKINQYLTQGYSDRDIYNMLEIPSSTYYNYKRQLQKESAERFKEQRLEDVAHYYDELYDRYSLLFRIGMEKANQAKEVMNPTKDFASTLREIKLLAKEMCDLKVNKNLLLHNKKQLTDNQPKLTDESGDESTDENPIV